MASTVRPKVKINDSVLEEVRTVWSAAHNGGVALDNAQLDASVSRFLVDVFNGSIAAIKQEMARKQPVDYSDGV